MWGERGTFVLLCVVLSLVYGNAVWGQSVVQGMHTKRAQISP
jgi:hypothetical protein